MLLEDGKVNVETKKKVMFAETIMLTFGYKK